MNAINIDFVMIAHQKKTVSSQHKAHANDVMVLGKDTFNELIFLDYFDAEYSNAIVHAFQKFRAPFSGKIVHIFPEQSAVI